jgi:hypothetical protein
MDSRHTLDGALKRLRARGASIPVCTLGDPLDPDSLPLIEELGGSPVRGARLDLYRTMDGVTLAWGLDDPALGAMSGGLAIPNALAAALRGGATEESEQQQGVLWHGDEPPQLLSQLRRMTIVNSVPGRNEFVTVDLQETPDRASWLDDGTLRPLVPDLSTCLALMLQHAGADGLLSHLVRADWAARLANDPRLAALREA